MSMLSVILTLCLFSTTAASREDVSEYTFEEYKRDFGRTYREGDGEHDMRQALFNKRVAEMYAHNERDLSWKLGINHFSDRTNEELQQLNGYKRWMRKTPTASIQSSMSSFLEVFGHENGNDTACTAHEQQCSGGISSPCCDGLVCGAAGICIQSKGLPESIDWATLPSANETLNQGPCGSCWAVAATGAIQLQAVINTKHRFYQQLSPQNILSCTPNEFECGGQGGCQGATAELGFQWLQDVGPAGGLYTMKQQDYTATDTQSKCPTQEHMRRSAFLQTRRLSPEDSLGPAISITGWKKIQENSAEQMMRHLVSVGPVVASIVGAGLHGYSTGIIKRCGNFVIDHAVLMMGYGNDRHQQMMYWKIRNSWGSDWGENGYFRLQRSYPQKPEPCGTDVDPSKGVACKDKPGPEGKYPNSSYVCGTCGILGDTAYPVGTHVPEELMTGAAAADSAIDRHFKSRLRHFKSRLHAWF